MRIALLILAIILCCCLQQKASEVVPQIPEDPKYDLPANSFQFKCKDIYIRISSELSEEDLIKIAESFECN
ncbi:MAG: hypothetical protein QFX37_03095 [Archaeoglobales archaeon]|nr:hypothetical protein [Archaeoglobales archaeon]